MTDHRSLPREAPRSPRSFRAPRLAIAPRAETAAVLGARPVVQGAAARGRVVTLDPEQIELAQDVARGELAAFESFVARMEVERQGAPSPILSGARDRCRDLRALLRSLAAAIPP